VNNSMKFGQPASAPRGLRLFAAAPGTCPLSGAVASLTAARGELSVVRPWSHELGLAAIPQVTKYQHMTRIAANGGDVSGSHPDWDPV
jgi:hypothetical protein